MSSSKSQLSSRSKRSSSPERRSNHSQRRVKAQANNKVRRGELTYTSPEVSEEYSSSVDQELEKTPYRRERKASKFRSKADVSESNKTLKKTEILRIKLLRLKHLRKQQRRQHRRLMRHSKELPTQQLPRSEGKQQKTLNKKETVLRTEEKFKEEHIMGQESSERNELPPVVLLACGSYSPPTLMHLRMFELARDFLGDTYNVVGGIVSPTHDGYGKKGLASGSDRLEMLKLATESSDWIRVSSWEVEQNEWSQTLTTLQHHQNAINNYITTHAAGDQNSPDWLPQLRHLSRPVRVMLLCGADLLGTFLNEKIWDPEHVDTILENHGVVVISREGHNPGSVVFHSDLLYKHRLNITIITNYIFNEVSSTAVRKLLSRGNSVKYLIDDQTLEYIKKNRLYGYNN